MVAIVSGDTLGLTASSRNILGGAGQSGSASTGQSGEQVFVNSATGNLVIQGRDESLTGIGIRTPLVRTYNSQGLLDDDNGDNWRLGVHQRLFALTGTANSTGSTITKTFGDGAEVVYTYSSTLSKYLSTEGDGAHDSLSFNSGTNEWTWTDASSRSTETYNVSGRLVASRDQDGNTLTYTYTGNLLTRVSAPGAQDIYFDYTGSNLTAVRVVSDGATQTLTRYTYDSQNRLSEVKVDLSPASDGIADGNVYVTTYTYDGTSKRVASITQSDGTTVGFTYQQVEGSYRVRTFTDGAGNVSTLNYVQTSAGSGGTVHANNSVLSDTETTLDEVEVPPYYYLQPGDSWASIAAKLYGDAALGEALRTALSNPTLTPAQQLAHLPSVLVDSATGSVHVRGSAWTSSSAVVQSYTREDGLLIATRHADGGYTSFVYDGDQHLVEIREHALSPVTPAWLQDFSVGSSGFDAFPSGVSTVENGGWTVRNNDGTSIVGAVDSFSTAAYDFDDHLTYRAEITFGDSLMDGYIAFGLLDVDRFYGHTAMFKRSELITTFKDGAWSTQTLGLVSANNTYVVEVETSSSGSTLFVYEKGTSRGDGFQHSMSSPGWGDTQMFIESYGSTGGAHTSVRIDNISVTGAPGLLVGDKVLPEDALDTVTAVTSSPDDYDVGFGDTWGSIATALYGSSTVANELQAALGSPTLTNPQKLSNLPATVTALALQVSPHVLNDSGGSASPVVNSYFDGDGRLIGTLHANGKLTSYVYDADGNLVARRQHATTAGLAHWAQDFSVDASGLGTLPSGYTTRENGGLTVHIIGGTDVYFDTLYDYEDHPVFRGEITTGPAAINGYFAMGASNPTNSRIVSAFIQGDQLRVVYRDFEFSYVVLGNVEHNTTYVMELAAGANGTTLYFYAKGQPRSSGYSWLVPHAEWGQMRMFFETSLAGWPPSDIRLDNLSVSAGLGSPIGPWFAREDAADVVDTFDLDGETYVVQSGDTWSSIALSLYGTGAVADELQAALGSPTLAPSLVLTDLPQILTDLDAQDDIDFAVDLDVALHTELQEVEVPVAPYYVVQSGDTWASIATTVYGNSDSELVAALQASLGNPSLVVGAHLTMPQTLAYGGGGAGISTEVTVESPLGLVTRLTNDASGRLIGVRGPAMGAAHLETLFAYDADGNVASITNDPSGQNRTTTHEYDANGNLTLSRDARGNTVTRTYSSTNQLLTQTVYTTADPDGAGSGQPSGALTTRYAYDAEDHLRFIISPEGRVSESRYNSLGLRTSAIQYTDAVYDLSGLSATTALTEAQLNTWAAARTLTTLQRVDYAYDFRGNLSTATAYASTNSLGEGELAGASVTHFVYDQRGQLLQTIDARGDATPLVADDYVTSFTYDGLGRVQSTTRWESSGITRTTVSEYDDANNQTEITLANGLIETRTFDGAGRLLSVTRSQGAQALGTTTYDYDSDGRLRRVTDPTGVSTHAVFDASGRKQFDVDGDGTLTEYVYDGASNLIKTIQYAVLANTALLVNGSNEPSDNVDVAALRGSASGNPAKDRIVRAVYDEANRLVFSVDADGAVTETRYDGASRVTDVITYATRVTIGASTNEISTATLVSLLTTSASDRRIRNFYDNEGNLLGSLDAAGYLLEYEYDAAGQLKRTIGYATATPSGQRASGTLSALRPAADTEHDVVAYFFYDGQGRQVGVLDGERYLTETVYAVNGSVAQTIRYDVRCTYTPGATLASLRPASLGASQIKSFEYDGQDRLVQETNAEGTVTRYQYDAVGNLIGVTRAQGTSGARETQARYDAMGRLVAELTAQGSAQITSGMTQSQVDAVWAEYSIAHQYDLAGRRVSTTDQDGNKTLFFYDADGRLTHTVNALGEVVERRYDALNQLTQTISYSNRISTGGLTGGLVNATLTSRVSGAADANKDTKTTLTYTLTGRVATSTTAEGAQVTFTYNAFGNQTQRVSSIDSTHSLTHTYTYDARGQLTRTQWDPTGFNTSQDSTYDAFGRVTSTTDANGNISQFAYDSLGRTVTTVDRQNATRHMAYDAFGRVLTTTDALNNTTAYVYDDGARSVVVTTPEGISLTTVRNRHGQTATVTDGRGYTTSYEFDANGQLIEVSDSQGTLNEQTYDRAGRLHTATDGNGVVTTITYDAANRVFTRSVDSGAGGLALTTTYAYDGLGRIVDTTDARGIVTRTQYDRDGHILAVTADYGTAPHLNLRTEYQYDDAGQMLLVTEGVGSANPRVTQYTYDALGRRISEVVDPGAGKLNLTTAYEYDKNGNVVRKVDARLNSTRFVYDAQDRLVYTVDALGGVTKNDYDAEGRIVRLRRYATAINVASLPASGVTTATQLEGLLAPVATDRVQQSVYDRDGRQVFVIDAMGGVTRKDYDENGNVVSTHIYSERIADGVYSSPASVTNALAVVNDGNLANDREVRTVYDARSQATFTIDGTGAVARNTFDDVGNLIARTEFAILRTNSGVPNLATMETWAATASNLDTARDRTTRMWYDGANRLVFTLNAEGHLTERRYDEVGNNTGDIAYAAAIDVAANASLDDVALAIDEDALRDQITTRVFDGAGRVTSVTDAEARTESYTYDAVSNRLTFTNKKQDVWTYVYDANRRLLEEHSPVVSITTVGESGGSLVPSTTSASLVTKMTYDALGNVTARTEAFGRAEARTTSYVYDALGRQVRVNLPQVSVYDSASDSLAREGAAVVRQETLVSPYSEVTYDVLGNAVMNRDAAGNYSHKVYDKLGRVLYEVDAERYVTLYAYDTFGNKTDITRFFTKLNDSGITSSTILSASTVAARVSAQATRDRTVHTDYDRLNRVASVTEPSALNYEPFYSTPGESQFSAGARTSYQYDAFGNVVREARLVNPGTDIWAYTFSYYDRSGQLSARVDPLGYLTTYEYDSTGNLTRQLEYATRLSAGNWSIESHGTPSSATPSGTPDNVIGYDRDLRVTYDRVGRRVTETLVGFEYNSVSGQTVTKIVADRVTSYGYDALGNRTRTTDPLGASTFTYYDALGRSIAIAQPAKDKGDGTFVTPLTQLSRDAFGNLTVQNERMNGASAVSETAFAAGSASASDRISYVQFNAYSHVVRSQDAAGTTRFASYNLRGDVAKEWQLVTDNDGVISAHVTVYEYDKLGRQTAAIDPQNSGESELIVRSESRYNAFGEVTARGNNDSFVEYFDYDQAGRVWRTNSGDGIDRVYLYNLAGQATAEIKSDLFRLSTFSDIYAVLGAAPQYIQRLTTRYNLNGQVVEQAQPGFFSGSQMFVPDNVQPLYAGFRLGDIDVPNNPAAVYRQVIRGSSVVFVVDESATLDQDGGYYYNGTTWAQDPFYELVTSRYVYWTATPDSLDSTKVFEYRLASDPDGPWQSLTVQTLPNGRYGVNVEAIDAGAYEYRVNYTKPEATEIYAQATGTMTLTGTPHIVPSIRQDQLDDAGVIPPIGLRPPRVTTTAGMPPVRTSVLSSSHVDDWWSSGSVFFEGSNEVKISFPDFHGPVHVELEYYTVATGGNGEPEYPSALRTITLYFKDARDASMGLALVWDDANPLMSAGGIQSVSKVRVYDHRSGQLLCQTGASLEEEREIIRSTVLMWKAPRDANVLPTFQVRRVGATNWVGLNVERQGSYLTVDTGKLANGDWEYEVSYTRDNVLTASAAGVLSIAGGGVELDSSAQELPFTAEPVAPIHVFDAPPIDPVEGIIEVSAVSVPNGGIEYADGFELDPTFSWTGNNIVRVQWDEYLTGEVRVELDYESAPKPLYESNGEVPSRWRLAGAGGSGISRSRTFDFTDVSGTAVTLSWADSDANGGVSSVEAIRVYVKDGSGNWVLHFTRDMSVPRPGRSLYWEPAGADAKMSVEIRPVGESEWTLLEASRFTFQDKQQIGVDISALDAGDYDYRVSYTFIDQDKGIARVLSRATGIISIPASSSGDPTSLTQNTLLFPDGEGNVGEIIADGTTLKWNRAPQTGTSMLVRFREEGTTTWQEVVPQGAAPNLYVDLGPGAVEYEILYYRADPLAPYARAVGVLSASFEDRAPRPGQPIPPIFTANVGPVEIDPDWVSAQQESNGWTVGFDEEARIVDHFPTTNAWYDENQISLGWESVGSVPVRVVLEYVTASRFTPSYGEYGEPGDGSGGNPGPAFASLFSQSYTDGVPNGWVQQPARVDGISKTRTFDFESADTGALLTWTDEEHARDGGISAIDRVKVYIQNSQGEWVLKYDRDGAAPVGGRSIYWQKIDDAGLTPVLRIKPVGTDEWVRLSVTEEGRGFHAADLESLSPGGYDYLLTYERFGVPVSNATGVITILPPADGSLISVTQSNVTLYDSLGDMGVVVAEGSEISWRRETVTGDTVIVRTRVVGTIDWVDHVVAGTGPDFTFEVEGSELAATDYEIVYVHDGETEPYARSFGTLNQRAAVIVNPARVSLTQQATFVTEPLPIESVRVTDKVVWSLPAEAGSTVTFRYRAVEETVWTALTVTTETNGFSVDPSALELGTYVYEIEYVRSGETEPYALASGTMIMRRVLRGGTPALHETTMQTGEVVFVEPLPKQQFDRWGNALQVSEANGALTGYRYNQLDQIVRVTQVGTLIVDTTGGTVTNTLGSAVLHNYYDLQGRLIGTRDGNGNVNSAAYNSAGEKIRDIHADGGQREYVYDTFGNQVQITDELGFRTWQTFDAAGRLLQTQRELVAGAFESGVQANLITESFDYDESGQRISETNGDGETTRYYYNLNGDVIRRVTPRGFETLYEYDLHGKKTRETDANGYYQSWTYDDWGRVQSHVDMGGVTTTYEYDVMGRLVHQSSDLGQDLVYDYDTAGRLIGIDDNGVSVGNGILSSRRKTEYTYDAAGHRIRERVTIDDLVHVDTQISYDALGRMRFVLGMGYYVEYSYDAAGNRTRINAYYSDHQRSGRAEDLWYTYDSMNRVLVSQGVNTGGSIGISSAQGLELTYNVGGQRTSARTYGTHITYTATFDWSEGWPVGVSSYSAGNGFVTELYGYDGAGRLITTDQQITTNVDGTPGTGILRTNTRTYDKASRELVDTTTSVENSGLSTRVRRNSYDDDGRVVQQSSTLNNLLESVVTYGDAVFTTGYYADEYWGYYNQYFSWTQGYDAAGTLRSYSVAVYDKGKYQYTTTYTIDYRMSDTYQQIAEHASSSTAVRKVTVPLPGSTRYVYNVNGELVQFIDEKDSSRNRYFANNADGQAVTVVQGAFTSAGPLRSAMRDALMSPDNRVKSQYFFFANGQAIGSFGQLTSANGVMEANFDVNYTPISSGYPASVPSQVIVQAGDTLRLLAARVFGDGNLWYVIAEENGLTDPDAPLTEGMVLQIPSEVLSLSNTSGTFKPFDISDALGDTTPTQPAPPPPRKKKGGCGVLGQIIIIVVAIIVTIYTAGAAAGAIGGAAAGTGGTFAAGTAVLTGAAGTVGLGAGGAFAAAAIGGAVGSIASQAVGIGLGIQDEFSWKAVGLSALGSGVGAGLGNAGAFKEVVGAVWEGNLFVAGSINAAAGSLLTQGLAVATGLQSSFSWREVAISAVSAPIAMAVGGKVGGALGGSKFATDVASGITGSLVRASFGGKIDATTVLADAFGNALANSIVDKVVSLDSPQARRERGLSGKSDRGSTREPSVIPEPTFYDPTLDLNPGEPIPAYTPTADDERNASSRQQSDAVQQASQASAAPEPMEEVVVTARAMTPEEQRVYDVQNALSTYLRTVIDDHDASEGLRKQVEGQMGIGRTTLTAVGGMMYGVYESAKNGVLALKDLTVAQYEVSQRLLGDLLHGDISQLTADAAAVWGVAQGKATAILQGMQNIALVMQDPTSRQMLVDFAVEYYGSSSQVTRSELLGVLPIELLIAAGTGGASTAVKSAGIAEKIGATLGELATALRAVEVRSPVIPLRPGEMGSMGIKGVQNPFVRVGDDLLFVNKAGTFYPEAPDLRTGRSIQFPLGDLQRVDIGQRVEWGAKQRGEFIRQWYQRGYETPRGGWSEYDIHHIRPREFGGSNDFWNLTAIPRQSHSDFNDFWKHY